MNVRSVNRSSAPRAATSASGSSVRASNILPIADAWIGTRRPMPASKRSAWADGHMIGDQHVVADADAETDRLTALGGQAPELAMPALETEAVLRAAAEGDQCRTQVIALGLPVLGDQPGGGKGPHQPMCRADRQS